MTPDGAHLTLTDGREYTADHVVVCNRLEMYDERWVPQHVGTTHGSRGRVLREHRGMPSLTLTATPNSTRIHSFEKTKSSIHHISTREGRPLIYEQPN